MQKFENTNYERGSEYRRHSLVVNLFEKYKVRKEEANTENTVYR